MSLGNAVNCKSLRRWFDPLLSPPFLLRFLENSHPGAGSIATAFLLSSNCTQLHKDHVYDNYVSQTT